VLLTPEAVQELALDRIERCLDIPTSVRPDAVTVSLARHAIPQFPVGHVDAVQRIQSTTRQLLPRVHLLSPYLTGVSINDCVKAAQHMSAQLLERIVTH